MSRAAKRKDPPEFCPTPKPPGCCQQPVFISNAAFVCWRCPNCGSESWT